MSRINGLIGGTRLPDGTAASVSGIHQLSQQYEWRMRAIWPFSDPLLLTGCQLWLDAADASTLYDAASGGSLVAADGGVARWQDKSGNGRHATQSTSGNRPLRKTSILGGKDVVSFDGTNDIMQLPTSFRWYPTGTMFAVLANASAGSGPWYAANNTDEPEIRLFRDTSSGRWYFNENYQLDNVAGHYNAIGSGSIRTIVLSGTSYKSYSNGTLKNSTTLGLAVSANNPASHHSIGGYSLNNTFCTIQLAELIFFDSALSDANRILIESYLITKWGIT